MTELFKKPSICWHTDPSEAFLIGTKESFIGLANKLLELAHSECTKAEVAEVTLYTPKQNDGLTECGLDIVVDSISFVECEGDEIKLINHFRELNGDLPLAE